MRSMIIYTVVILACGIAFKANPQRQSNNPQKITVATYSTNTSEIIHIENLIKSSITTELRKLGVVETIHVSTGEWDHLIHIDIVNPHQDMLVVCVNYHSKIPERFMTEEWKKNSRKSQIYAVAFPNIGNIHIATLTETEEIAKQVVANYNNTLLQYTLDAINSQSR